MAGKIQENAPEKWRNQDHVKPYHRIREVRMQTPHRAEPDPSTIGFGITSTPTGGGDGGTEDKLPTTIRRAPIFAGNSVSEAHEVPFDDPKRPLQGKQGESFRRPVVPANTAKDSVLGEHVQGPVSQRYQNRQTKNRGGIHDATVFHSNRPPDPEIEI